MLAVLFVLGSLGFLSLLGHFVDKSVGILIMAFVEDKFGAFPHLLLYCLLEWVIILLIYGDSFLSFLSNEVSRLFEMRIPCLLCTRIDHALINGCSTLYCNDSLCDTHKKVVSSLAYCNSHKKLSDSRTMCQGCLLSSTTEKDFVGILNKEVDFFLEDDSKARVKAANSKKDDQAKINTSDEECGVLRCSCCGEPLKPRSSSKFTRSWSTINAPPPSPQVPVVSNEGGGNMETPHVKYSEVKLVSDAEVELPKDEDASNVDANGRVDAKAITAPLLPDSNQDMSRDASRTPKTPGLGKGNRILRHALSEVQMISPRWANRDARRPSLDKIDFSLESNDEGDGDILSRLKRQVETNRKNLMALYMELDEERSASTIAANNAMAMITRLQAEKAAVQMEALQYKRMKEEQAEYDQEALQEMRDLLLKREEDVKGLEAELGMYREKYGDIKHIGSEVCEVDVEEDYQGIIKSPAVSMFSDQKSECGSLSGADQNENDQNSCVENGGGNTDEDFEGERSYFLNLLRNLEGNGNEKPDSSEPAETDPEDEENNASGGIQTKATFTRELSLMRERLRVIEADSGFLKHTAKTLEREGDEGTKLLTEIAEHLRQLRQPDKAVSEDTMDGDL